MIAPDHATFDLNNYMNRLDKDSAEDKQTYDVDGFPLIYGEKYWTLDDGRYVMDDAASMHNFLDSEHEDYGDPIDYDYGNLEEIMEEFKSAEVITWM